MPLRQSKRALGIAGLIDQNPHELLVLVQCALIKTQLLFHLSSDLAHREFPVDAVMYNACMHES